MLSKWRHYVWCISLLLCAGTVELRTQTCHRIDHVVPAQHAAGPRKPGTARARSERAFVLWYDAPDS